MIMHINIDFIQILSFFIFGKTCKKLFLVSTDDVTVNSYFDFVPSIHRTVSSTAGTVR